jgi:hypothetical protein
MPPGCHFMHGNDGIHDGKHPETRINSVILYFCFKKIIWRECYSETAQSEVHYSEEYLYLYTRYSRIGRIVRAGEDLSLNRNCNIGLGSQ